MERPMSGSPVGGPKWALKEKRLKYRGVQGGTKPNTRLCDTCRNSVIVRGSAESEELVVCDYMARSTVMKFPVVECSEYDDKRYPSKFHMESIGWVLVTQKAGREIGFLPPKKYEVMKKAGEIEDDDDD